MENYVLMQPEAYSSQRWLLSASGWGASLIKAQPWVQTPRQTAVPHTGQHEQAAVTKQYRREVKAGRSMGPMMTTDAIDIQKRYMSEPKALTLM